MTRPARSCLSTIRWQPACAQPWSPWPTTQALVRAALEIEEVFGPDLRQDAVLADQLTAVLTRIVQAGLRAALSPALTNPDKETSRWPKLTTC